MKVMITAFAEVDSTQAGMVCDAVDNTISNLGFNVEDVFWVSAE